MLAQAGVKGLPHGLTVETKSVDVTSPAQVPFGRVFEQVCTSVTIFPLQPMSPAEALMQGLLNKSGGLVQHRTICFLVGLDRFERK